MHRTWWVMVAAWLAACGTQVSVETDEAGAEATQGAPLRSEDAGRWKERVEQLNRRLLGADGRRPEVAAQVLAERARALESLAAVDARSALEQALPERVLAQVAQRVPAAAAQLEEWGAWEGELEVIVVDSPSLRELRTDHFVTVGRQRHALRFARAIPEGLRSGLKLKVRGLRVGRHVIAEDVHVDTRAATLAETAGVCATTGEQRSIVILAAFPGQAQPALTQQQVSDAFFDPTNRSLTDYWFEASEGRTTTSGNVVGWYTLDRAYGCEETDLLREAALRAADADVDFTQYNRVFIVHPRPLQGCSYAGLATLSCGTLVTNDGAVTASTAWLVAESMGNHDSAVELVTHEAGHNLSLHHANSRDFGAEPLGPMGAQGLIESYGDLFSTMGYWNLGHYAAPHKARIGWLEPGAVAEVDGTGGTFTLSPYETSGGLKALKVRRGTDGEGWLWLEYRQPLGGYDTALGPQVFGGALVHFVDSWTDVYSHLLDFTPGTDAWSDPALPVGSTWTDPYTNLSLTVQSASPAGLTVSVDYGAVDCVPAPPEVIVTGWQETAWPGGRPEFNVTIANRDTMGCAPSTFQLGAFVPAGWTFDPLPAQVTVAPGSAVDVGLQTYAPYSTASGTYTVGATATREGQTVQGSATVEIIERCTLAPPTVSISPQEVTARPGSEATFTVTVTNHDSASCDWVWYDFVSTLPDGWDTTFSDWGVNLPPGGSFTFTFSKTVPVGVTGSHAVDLQLHRDGVGLEATGSATCVVSRSGRKRSPAPR